MPLLEPIHPQWSEDAMSVELTDSAHGVAHVRLVLITSVALAIFGAGFLMAATPVGVVFTVVAAPALVAMLLYFPDTLFVANRVQRTALVLRPDRLEISGTGFREDVVEVPLGRIRGVHGQVHPRPALVLMLGNEVIEVGTGGHDPAAVDELAAEITRAAAKHREFLKEHKAASSEHGEAIRALGLRVDE